MKTEFPNARSYTAEAAHFPPRTIVDIQAEQRQVSAAYSNTVLLDVNGDCMRLAVFEGEYRWLTTQTPTSCSWWWRANSRLISMKAHA